VSPFRRSFRSSPFSSRLRRRRRFEWVGAAQAGASLIPPTTMTTTAVIIDNAQISGMTEPTLKRVHGCLVIEGGQLATTVGAFGGVVALGIQVMAGASIANPETPWTHLRSGRWLWHQMVPLFTLDNPTDLNAPTTASARVMIDAKAQRRIDEFDVVVLSAELVPGSTWEQVDFMWGVRALLEQV